MPYDNWSPDDFGKRLQLTDHEHEDDEDVIVIGIDFGTT
jgi:hypothetical protein